MLQAIHLPVSILQHITISVSFHILLRPTDKFMKMDKAIIVILYYNMTTIMTITLLYKGI